MQIVLRVVKIWKIK